MTLEEAIRHEEELVERNARFVERLTQMEDMKGAEDCQKAEEEHRQMARWLGDLKKLSEVWDKVREEIKGIPENPDYQPIGTYDYVRGAEDCQKVVLEIIDKNLAQFKEKTKDEQEEHDR